jgi:Carboxypeptidase regulatory-like domain
MLGVLLAVAPSRTWAQAIFGSVNGLVTDASGAAVPNATITMTDTDKGTTRVVTSSESGEYLVHDLIPDHYKLKVEVTGFATAESDLITVSADSSAQMNFQLKLGPPRRRWK